MKRMNAKQFESVSPGREKSKRNKDVGYENTKNQFLIFPQNHILTNKN